MEENGKHAKRERDASRVDSLGWLTESAVLPKKQRAIEGVGPSSIVELRAQLYRTQEDVKRAKDLGVDPDVFRPKKKIDAFLKRNSGVEDRATRFVRFISFFCLHSFRFWLSLHCEDCFEITSWTSCPFHLGKWGLIVNAWRRDFDVVFSPTRIVSILSWSPPMSLMLIGE